MPLLVQPAGLGVPLSSFTRCLGVPSNGFSGCSGVPPNTVHVFRIMGVAKSRSARVVPRTMSVRSCLDCPRKQRLSSGDDPLFPCRICVSQLPPGSPIALCSLLLRQGTLSSAQRWPRCWEACLPEKRWTLVGKHLGAISSTCYLESGSWNRVGRNKADSILSLINDCWDRGAGAGLARRYHGVTSGQECTARLWGFCCAGLRDSPAPCCCVPMLFPFHPLRWDGWCCRESCSGEQEGGWWWSFCLWTGLVHREGLSCPSCVVSCLITSSWLCQSFGI